MADGGWEGGAGCIWSPPPQSHSFADIGTRLSRTQSRQAGSPPPPPPLPWLPSPSRAVRVLATTAARAAEPLRVPPAASLAQQLVSFLVPRLHLSFAFTFVLQRDTLPTSLRGKTKGWRAGEEQRKPARRGVGSKEKRERGREVCGDGAPHAHSSLCTPVRDRRRGVYTSHPEEGQAGSKAAVAFSFVPPFPSRALVSTAASSNTTTSSMVLSTHPAASPPTAYITAVDTVLVFHRSSPGFPLLSPSPAFTAEALARRSVDAAHLLPFWTVVMVATDLRPVTRVLWRRFGGTLAMQRLRAQEGKIYRLLFLFYLPHDGMCLKREREEWPEMAIPREDGVDPSGTTRLGTTTRRIGCNWGGVVLPSRSDLRIYSNNLPNPRRFPDGFLTNSTQCSANLTLVNLTPQVSPMK
ncbi:hypothetical protein C8R45DRAFT_1081258, partial [Mycena sanguinolenta]